MWHHVRMPNTRAESDPRPNDPRPDPNNPQPVDPNNPNDPNRPRQQTEDMNDAARQEMKRRDEASKGNVKANS